ncbi:MAG: alanine dehydrogenase [Holophagales bacterium]|nr:alanine dehydrogenase [Holophagales bacterium]
MTGAAMNIGIPKECRPDEFRVGISPVGVRMLRGAGHPCFVEAGAGNGAGFTDEQYRQAGATIVHTAEEVWRRADLALKVSRPTMQEIDWLQPGKALMGYLYLAAAHPGKVDLLLEKSISAVAYEQIQLADGSLPVLKPLSQIGGRMAAQVAAHLLQNDAGGHGKLLGGVPGVPPAEVVVIGAGVAGEAAARAFLGMGAHVTVLDRELARLQTLDEALSGRLVTVVAHPFHVARAAEYADVVVGAVMVPGERSPHVLTRAMLRKMKPGALFIDLSIDQGGCAETSRPTTHEAPTYVENGVVHCCIPNLGGVVARTSTHAFLNAAAPWIERVVVQGVEAAAAADPALACGVVTHAGELRNFRRVSFTRPVI